MKEIKKLSFEEEVKKRLAEARSKHSPINSYHEGYAVLLEELDELWDEVRKRNPNKPNLRRELIDIAAMAQRMAEDRNLLDYLHDDEPVYRLIIEKSDTFSTGGEL